MPDAPDVEARQRRLAEQEMRLQFSRFGHEEAWHLGSRLVELARLRDFPVVIGVDLGEQTVFRAGLPGSSPDNDRWLERKFAAVRRYLKCSLALSAMGEHPDIYDLLGIDRATYAFAGGAFPIRVNGTLVGTVGVSGLTSSEDHELVVEVLEELTAAEAR